MDIQLDNTGFLILRHTYPNKAVVVVKTRHGYMGVIVLWDNVSFFFLLLFIFTMFS